MRLFAVLGTWMEEDVVEATVANAFAQGVEAVYLVDNASTDGTVDRAVAAGAVVAESYRTEAYEERIRMLLMNAVVARVSLASDAQHIWWLWLDADEFPEGPEGVTIGDYLRGLDRRFRLVGSTYFNHFPTDSPMYIPGFHPIDFQAMCQRVRPRAAGLLRSAPLETSVAAIRPQRPFSFEPAGLPRSLTAHGRARHRTRGRDHYAPLSLS